MPGVIEAENFDRGGEGAAYHDDFGATQSLVYRGAPIEGVDVQARTSASGGYVVMEFGAGEWMSYQINAAAGTYDLGIRYASEFGGGTFHIEVDGVDVTGQIFIVPTPTWGTFRNSSRRVTLTAGPHIIKLVGDSNSSNPQTGGQSPVIANFDSLVWRATPNDLNADGRADLGVFRPSTGGWFFDNTTTGALRPSVFGLAGDIPVATDFDGDGRPDTAVFRPSNGVWYVIKSSDGTFTAAAFGLNGDIPVPSDLDGDGLAEYAVFRPSNGVWYHLGVNGFGAYQFGMSGDVPVPADYDGDGRDDLAVYRPSTGVWHLMLSANQEYKSFRFGLAEDIPTPADFDGDGRSDVAVYRPSDGIWHRLLSFDGAYSAVRFGLAGDIPVVADYDGDGRRDIAVWRPSTGVWYQLNSSTGLSIRVFGLPGDVPLIR